MLKFNVTLSDDALHTEVSYEIECFSIYGMKAHVYAIAAVYDKKDSLVRIERFNEQGAVIYVEIGEVHLTYRIKPISN